MIALSITKNGLLLGTFAVATTLLLALTAEVTRDRIATAEREAQQKALFEIVPQANPNENLLTETIAVPEDAWAGLGLKKGGDIYVARHADETIAVIIPAIAPDGYSGDIRMLVGINADGTIAGVRILDHHETPGLGDKIELKKTSWVLAFNQTSLQSPKITQWKVKKDGGDFDQFAGATITPRAVVNQVRRVLEFADSHRDSLFTKKTSQTTATQPELNATQPLKSAAPDNRHE